MIIVKNLEDLHSLAEQCVIMKIPRNVDINLFGTEDSFKKLNSHLKGLGSGNVDRLTYNKYGETNVFIDRIIYCGYCFNLIYMNEWVM